MVVQRGKPGGVVGVVSERDVLRAFAQEIAPDANILSISTREDIRIEMDADLSEAARLMA